MKYCFRLLLPLVCCAGTALAQAPDAAQMRARIEAMKNDPKALMRYRDSLMGAVVGQQAKKLPNGDQLLLKHHYDTGYVKVQFNYKYHSVVTNSGHESSIDIAMSGTAAKAPMIYEANGHTIVQANMGQKAAPGAALLTRGANGLNDAMPYTDAGAAQKHTDMSRQMAFSAMAAANNKLNAMGSYTYSDDGGGHAEGKGLSMAVFQFNYDPVQNFSTVSAGGTMGIITKTGPDTTGIGMNGMTDKSKAHFAGAPQLPPTTGETYINVTKTPTGFKITYDRKSDRDHDGISDRETETLTATIGENVQQYTATIKPYQSPFYERWLPNGPRPDNAGQTEGDDSLRFIVTVADSKDASKRYPGTFKVKWLIDGATHYRGYCSNYPAYTETPDEKPDLLFSDSLRADAQHFDLKAGDTIAASGPKGNSDLPVRIRCKDYGAWGKLAAVVTLEDGTEMPAYAYYDKATPYVTIPYDRDENKLADAWEKMMKIDGKKYRMEWDEETRMPDNKHNGDDITLLDEYRGFVVDSNNRAMHARLDPNKKEVFILTTSTQPDQHTELIKKGARLYKMASGVCTYTIGVTAATFPYMARTSEHASRFASWVNYNSPWQPHRTYGVPIFFNPTGPDHPSEANTKCLDEVPIGNGAYPPAEVDYVNIFRDEVVNNVLLPKAEWFLPYETTQPNSNAKIHLRHAKKDYNLAVDTTKMGNIIKSKVQLLADRYNTVSIAHEIGHATGIVHHHLWEVKVSKSGETIDAGAYHGVATCPMRYWVNTMDADNKDRDGCNANYDRMEALLTGEWDPNTGLWPDGKTITFCTGNDDCQMMLTLKKK